MLDKKLMQLTLEEISNIRSELLTARDQVDSQHPRYRSLLNLKHYQILRSKDRTRLQENLSLLSLSSLGRSYSHVAGSIDALYDQISSSLHGDEISQKEMDAFHHLSIRDAIKFASKNSTRLFGGKVSSKINRHHTSIMMTLPTHAVDNDGELIRSLVQKGVNVFRINTAHDKASVWKTMADVIANINETREKKHKIKIFVDLAGPKIRTGKIMKLSLPVGVGSNKREKEVHIVLADSGKTKPAGVDSRTRLEVPASIAVEENFFKKIKLDTTLRVVDANERKASIVIFELGDTYAKGMIDRKVYLNESSQLYYQYHKGVVANIETQIDSIRLFRDDLLEITELDVLGHSAYSDKNGLNPALISCSLKGVVPQVKIGESVFIDDGKISLEVIKKTKNSIITKVIDAKENGTLLKEEKGINFPNTSLKTESLTQADRENLLEVLDFADSLSISFCQSAQDIKSIENILMKNNRSDIGIIAKIETKQAIMNMYEILEQLLRWEKSGVMIARGDLAIEVGFKNMAHVQETLLDICDAAHMPVILATQVLENQMKNNLPSRAEVTDAAMAGRAECIMLNKGAFATNTIDVLTYILNDMHTLFKKNMQLLKKEILWK